MKKMSGRPLKFKEEELDRVLIEYSKRFRGRKITITELSKYSKIPYYILRDNKYIRERIIEANEFKVDVVGISEIIHSLPNIVELIENNYANKDKLIDALKHYNEVFEDLMAYAKRTQKIEEENILLKMKLEDIKKQKDLKKQKLLHLERKINEYYINFSSIKKSKILGIDKRKMDSEKINPKTLSSKEEDLKKYFPELFQLE